MKENYDCIRNLSFDCVAIVYNDDVEQSLKVANYIKEYLSKIGIVSQICSSDKLLSTASFAIVAGGDGTLLKVARYYASKNVPIFGVNLGRLGFLAQVNLDGIDSALKKLLNSEYRIEKRMMLSSRLENAIALNDIVVKGDSFSRTSKLFLSINDKVVCDYLADGIIISTPTGSTAYTLSAGGPVVSPELEAFVVVPICAHTLTARPLVVPAHEKIKITGCDNCNKLKMSADGQNVIELDFNSEIVIEKSELQASLVILDDDLNDFYSILRHKLQWGVGPEC